MHGVSIWVSLRYIKVILTQYLVSFTWKVCRKHIYLQIINLTVKVFIFYIQLSWCSCIDPNRHNFACLVHFLNKFRGNVWYLQVTTATLGYHVLSWISRDVIIKVMEIECRNVERMLGKLRLLGNIRACLNHCWFNEAFVYAFKFNKGVVAKWLHHTILCQAVVLNLLVKKLDSHLPSILASDLQVTWYFELQVSKDWSICALVVIFACKESSLCIWSCFDEFKKLLQVAYQTFLILGAFNKIFCFLVVCLYFFKGVLKDVLFWIIFILFTRTILFILFPKNMREFTIVSSMNNNKLVVLSKPKLKNWSK